MKILLSTLTVLLLTVAILFSLTACEIKVETEIRKFTFETDVLKVGIISDSQLQKTDGENEFQNNLKRALSVLKSRNVHMILFAGDITDASKSEAYDLYNEAIDSIYGNDRPLIQSIMGNHDYWENGTPANCRKLFESKLDQSPWTHYVVNGYHFIGASPDSGSMDNGYHYMKSWLVKELDKAVSDSSDKPIFVMTHNGAKDTMYGSDDWGDKNLDSVFKDYPQVVNFSGHSHYSILDERSIHQKDYTSITTQSVSYTELEVGKENGTIPPNSSITPMGFVMDIYSDKVVINRVNFAKDEETNIGYYEKTPWTLPIPLTKDSFNYTFEKRASVNTSPKMQDVSSGKSYEESDSNDNGKIKTFLEFTAGADDDFVHSYKLVWSNGDEQLYFSDFYNGIADMDKTVKLPVNMKKGTYSVKVYAVDSWGLVSENYTEITNVKVN